MLWALSCSCASEYCVIGAAAVHVTFVEPATTYASSTTQSLLSACLPIRRRCSRIAAGRSDIQTGQAVLVSKLDTLLQRQQLAIDAMNAANSQLAAIKSLAQKQADAIAALDAAANDRLNAISVATQQGIINLYKVCTLKALLGCGRCCQPWKGSPASQSCDFWSWHTSTPRLVLWEFIVACTLVPVTKAACSKHVTPAEPLVDCLQALAVWKMARRDRAVSNKISKLAGSPCSYVPVAVQFSLNNSNSVEDSTARDRTLGMNNRVLAGLMLHTWRSQDEQCAQSR
eukprot:GHRQ01031930.1.p1 GENE.GHRQ01031930.1~~GHRQ01031930.1.p1  ORF type:complete len:309 (+),score=71.83 GHRQ01031930.1:70-927(+)